MGFTPVHDPAIVHVRECPAELHKVLPDRLLRDEPLLLLEMLNHSREVAGVGEFEHDVQHVDLDEGGSERRHDRH